jgi:hypothetical protein
MTAHKLTVAVTADTAAALEAAAATTGDTRTDTLNRAVQLYAQLADAVARGSRVLLAGPGNTETPVEVRHVERVTVACPHQSATFTCRTFPECPCGDTPAAEEDTWFDRSVCPPPCGAMHERYVSTGRPADGCPHEEA